MIFMWEKTISRMMSLPLSLPQGMTGGFMPRRWPVRHVVVKSKDGELPDHIFEIAGQLAAYYSKGRTAPKVEIDYIQKKQVKKPAGAKPGFVVYYTNYSLMAEPSLKGVREV